MSESVTHVRIVGEPFLSRAREHRKRWLAWHAAWLEFAQSKGATGFGSTCNDLSFKDRAPPEGWTKPKGEGRFSHPKAKHPDATEFARMQREHKKPVRDDVFGDALCPSISFVEPSGLKRESGIVGLENFDIYLNGAWVGWAGDTFLGAIPDAEVERQRYAAEHPERTIVGPAATWTLPEGLVRITKAEMDLIVAEHRVAEERAKASDLSARPLPLTGEG